MIGAFIRAILKPPPPVEWPPLASSSGPEEVWVGEATSNSGTSCIYRKFLMSLLIDNAYFWFSDGLKLWLPFLWSVRLGNLELNVSSSFGLTPTGSILLLEFFFSISSKKFGEFPPDSFWSKSIFSVSLICILNLFSKLLPLEHWSFPNGLRFAEPELLYFSKPSAFWLRLLRFKKLLRIPTFPLDDLLNSFLFFI